MRLHERHTGEARLSGGMREGFAEAGRLPSGVRLYRIGADGTVVLADRDGARELGPDKDLLRFIDDGQFAHYLVGDAKTSPERPSNATVKLGIVGPRSAFTPHAHGGEHHVLSLGYASCGLYDAERDRVTEVPLAPGELIRIPAPILTGIRAQSDKVLRGSGAELAWPGLLRRLARQNPGHDG